MSLYFSQYYVSDTDLVVLAGELNIVIGGSLYGETLT